VLDLLLFGGLTDQDAEAWISAVRAAGGWVSDGRARRVERLIKALKASGAWALRDDYAAYAGAENPTQALVTLKRHLVQVANNSPTLGAFGYTGNNTTAFIDTKWNPASGTWQYTQNLAAYGCYVAADPGVATTKALIGNSDGWSEIVFGSGGNITAGINQSATPLNVSPSNRLGLLEVDRTGASAFQVFQNGSSLGAGTTASGAVANLGFYVLAANSAGGAVAPINSTIAMAFIGVPLSASVQAAELQAWKPFLSLYGVP
jgi:hypothetical protein